MNFIKDYFSIKSDDQSKSEDKNSVVYSLVEEEYVMVEVLSPSQRFQQMKWQLICFPDISVIEQMMNLHEELYFSGKSHKERHEIADYLEKTLSVVTNKEFAEALKIALFRFYRIEYNVQVARKYLETDSPQIQNEIAEQLGCAIDVFFSKKE
jgi:hypothetical protein